MPTLTAHAVVKNEENFIEYAIRSVVDFVDCVLIFDTGSTDKTVEILSSLKIEYPDKIIFEKKGECDKVRHTELRQEMLERTNTEWFMILDGDEVWTSRGMNEVKSIIISNSCNCIVSQYYLCVGDIYHHSVRGQYAYNGKKIHALPRVFKNINNISWSMGSYGEGDYLLDSKGDVVREGNYLISSNPYWHMSALVRSSKDSEIILGRHKQVMTYSLKFIGEGLLIKESLPEVFLLNKTDSINKLSVVKSWINLFCLLLYKLKFINVRYYE